MKFWFAVFAETFDNVEFQTLLIENGNIFVGATNAILQFDDDLSLLKQFNTGPASDGQSCFSPLYCAQNQNLCPSGFQCTNNYNILLLKYRDRLLACGTLHAACDLLMLDDIARIFGNRSDLQCAREEPIRKVIQITSRNRSIPIVAAVHVNSEQNDSDLFYLGRSPDPINTLIAPSSENSYFSYTDMAENYLSDSRQALYHLAWTDDEYAYILWTDLTNNELKLARYCHEITSTFSRSDVENDIEQLRLNQGVRTYTEITLQCNSNGNVATDVVEAKIAFNTLYVLFRSESNNIAKICSSTLSSLNDNFDFVRSQCWNSTDSTSVANLIRAANNACSSQSDFTNEWVSF